MKQTANYMLYDKKGRLLLMLRTMDAPTHPGYWGLFGGAIEEGESPGQAIKREAKEELDIELKKMKFFKIYEHKDEYGEMQRHVFIAASATKCSTDELRGGQDEGDDLGFSH